ncbi:MAG: hypothetical protein IJS29_00795 [Selenomonadaceae bacterium]|nr:hypothetical protein [Selenomonadaceae bacterium]
MSSKLKKALAVAAILLFGAVNLSNFNQRQDVIHVETYRVKAGDTFWNVTEYYRDLDARNLYIFDYQDEVRELNPHLTEKNCQLQPNDLITVHYVKK